MTIPVVRGPLNCTVMPDDRVLITYYTDYTLSLIAFPKGNRQSLNYTFEAQLMANPNDYSRFALFSMTDDVGLDVCSIEPVLLFLPRSGSDPQAYDFFSTLTYIQNHTYCPLYGGMFSATTASSIQDYTWFVCSTGVERVDALTTFSLPDYTILGAFADETTATCLPGHASRASLIEDNGETNSDVSFRGPNSALYGPDELLDANEVLSFYNMSDGQNYDKFFLCLVYGRDGVQSKDIAGEANIPRLLTTVQHLWRVVYAQRFRLDSTKLSADSDDVKAWAPNGAWNGTLLDPKSYRLAQSIVSTRVLQGTLAALALCGICAFVGIGSTKRLLPNNPSSIAVVASLLAGSDSLQVVQKRQKDQEELQVRKDDPWTGYLFSMGWWDRKDGDRRFSVDIGRADAPPKGNSPWNPSAARASLFPSNA